MRHILAAIAIVTAGAPAAFAQPSAPLRLSLDEALARGLAASPRLVEAEARGDAASAVVEQREAARLPQIAALAGYTWTNHVDEFGVPLPDNRLRVIYPDIPDNYRTRLDVQLPLYTGGRQAAAERAARLEVGAVEAEGDALRSDLRFEITRAYWSLVTSSSAVAVMDAARERTTSHLAEVRNQLAAGLAAPNDVLTVEAQEARQRMLVIRAEAARASAEADLARLVDAPPGMRIVPIDPLDAPAPEVDAPIDVLTLEARERRADRAVIVERVATARARREAAASGMRPTVALAGGFDYAQPNPRIFPREESWRTSWDASINLTWPLSDGGRVRAETAEAEALVRAAEARLEEFDRVLAVEIGHRLRELEADRAAIEAAEAGVRAAAEARRVAENRFAAGLATNTDVLAAQAALLQAELDRTEALAALRLSAARLDRVLGR